MLDNWGSMLDDVDSVLDDSASMDDWRSVLDNWDNLLDDMALLWCVSVGVEFLEVSQTSLLREVGAELGRCESR